MLLGVAFKATGSGPLPSIPLKGDYAKRDFLRSARFHGIAFRMPDPFPSPPLPRAGLSSPERRAGAGTHESAVAGLLRR